MKTNKIYFMLLLVFTLDYCIPQDLNVQEFIGKQGKDVIAKYGTPVHQDNSMPSMICLFYKSPSMVFVADETSVYQTEITKEYPSEDLRKTDLDDLIKKSLMEGFTADTLSGNKIVLSKQGIITDVDIINLKEKNLFEIKVKSVRRD